MKPQTTEQITRLGNHHLCMQGCPCDKLWIPDALNTARMKFIEKYLTDSISFRHDYTLLYYEFSKQGKCFTYWIVTSVMSGVFDDEIEKEMKK